MKVLWIGDAVVNSGFSIVTHNICNELVALCDLEVFGIRYDGRMRHNYPYHIYPGKCDQDIYSMKYAEEVVRETSPDVVVVFNDDRIIEAYAELIGSLARIVPMFPVNLLPLDQKRMVRFRDHNILTYTEFARSQIESINSNPNITAVYHGVDTVLYSPIESAKMDLGLKNFFVVGTVASNTYRKRLDLFLKGFAKFAENKGDVKCLVHSTNMDACYSLEGIAGDLRISDKVIMSNTPKEFADMNILYNLMDVNVNTSLGEGFGLPLIEGAACGVPVLCPEHGNLTDIWTQGAEFIKIREYDYMPGTTTVGGTIDIDDFVAKLDYLYEDRSWVGCLGAEALDHSRKECFEWRSVADKVYKSLFAANSGRISYIS